MEVILPWKAERFPSFSISLAVAESGATLIPDHFEVLYGFLLEA